MKMFNTCYYVLCLKRIVVLYVFNNFIVVASYWCCNDRVGLMWLLVIGVVMIVLFIVVASYWCCNDRVVLMWLLVIGVVIIVLV